ncbi:MAG TPA: DUF6691 family protein [Luteibaculaceae bacterium]|nr:DUF6691 family protein [Luteibaculaceae bacterium]
MRRLFAFLIGSGFGWVLIEAQVFSWYRIQEMFHFENFHMFGTIGSAIAVGALSLWIIRRFQIKSIYGKPISIPDKPKQTKSNILGGLSFGLGWGICGACTAPIFILFGLKPLVGGLILLGALLGAALYNGLSSKLPH